MGNIFVNKGQQLEDAVREGNISKVQGLLRDGASMGWKNYVGMNNNQAISLDKHKNSSNNYFLNNKFTLQYGWTALHWASYNAYVEIIELLLDKGANLNSLNNDNKLPIDICGYNCRNKELILKALSVLQEASRRHHLNAITS